MCFVIELGQEKPYIASRDIRCYKVMTREAGHYFRSKFLHFKYETGVVYRKPFRIKLSKPRHFGDVIYVGYHSYRSKAHAENHCDSSREVVVRCIIPKGTLFFQSTFYYVSNGIKIEGIVH